MKKLNNFPEFWTLLIGVNIGIIIKVFIDTILKWLNIQQKKQNIFG